jgi:hypothetical protein
MTVDIGMGVPRSRISLGVEPTLRRSLAQLAKGRVLVVDYFASRRCSVVIGDITGDFEDAPPAPGFVELASIEGVPVFAESRLLAVLADAGSTLRFGGLPFAKHITVEFDRLECWFDFLERPGVLAGKRRFRRQ